MEIKVEKKTTQVTKIVEVVTDEVTDYEITLKYSDIKHFLKGVSDNRRATLQYVLGSLGEHELYRMWNLIDIKMRKQGFNGTLGEN